MFSYKLWGIKRVLEVCRSMSLLHVRKESLAHLLKLILSAINIFWFVILDEVVLGKSTENHLVAQLLRWFFGWILASLVAKINELIRVLGLFSNMIAKFLSEGLLRHRQKSVLVFNMLYILSVYFNINFFFIFGLMNFILILWVLKLALMTCYHLHFSRSDLNFNVLKSLGRRA